MIDEVLIQTLVLPFTNNFNHHLLPVQRVKTNREMELQMSSSNSTAQVFEDFQINVKLKISALWVAVMFCYVYGDYIEIYVPGVLAEAMLVKSTTETQ